MSKPIEANSENSSIALCPSCRKTVPVIKVDRKEGHFFLQIQCTCSKKAVSWKLEAYLESVKDFNKMEQQNCNGDNHGHIKGEKYCTICQKWMCKDCLASHKQAQPTHVLRNREVNLGCSKHKMELKDNCIDCKLSICEKCSNHQGHKITKSSYDNGLKKITTVCEGITAVINLNQKYNENFNKWIDAEKPKESLRAEVNGAYNRNKEINTQLKELCLLLKQTAEILGQCLNCSLTETISSLKVAETAELPLSSTELEKSSSLLKKHFTEEYALSLGKEVAEEPQVNKHTYECLKSIKIEAFLYCLYQLNDGRLVTGDRESRIQFWDSSTFEVVKSIEKLSGTVTVVYQLKDQRMVSGNSEGKIGVWDVTSYESLQTVAASSDYITVFLQLKDGRLISGGSEKVIKVWDVSTFDCLNTVQTNGMFVRAIVELSDGRLLTCGDDKMLNVWNASTFECVKSSQAKGAIYKAIQLRDDTIVSGGDCDYMDTWGGHSFELISSQFVGLEVSVSDLLQLKDGRLVSGGSGGGIKVWDVLSFKLVTTMSPKLRTTQAFVQQKNGLLVSLCNDFSDKISYLHKWDV